MESIIAELKAVLFKHGAEIIVRDIYEDCESKQDIRMIIEFNNSEIPDIDLGSFINGIKE